MSKQFTKFKETEIGAVPEEWDVVDIDKALNIIDGDRGVNYPNGSDFSDNGYCVFLNAKNVCGDSFDFSNCQFISQAKDVELRKGKMKRGDFVLTTRGTVGNIAFYDKAVPFENMRINSGMVILRNDKDFDSKYLFQFLKSWITKKQIIELTTGSAQPQLPIRDLKNLKLIKPAIEEQKQIAEILSCLDNKIELNRKINNNLEKVASSLFKHWFVDFEFPNEDGKPYKSSDGKMIDSELGEIPEGWRAGNFNDIAKITSGKRPGEKKENMTADFNIPLLGASSTMGYVKEHLYNEPILITGRVGTHGIIQKVDYPCWPSDNTLVIKSRFLEFTNQVMKCFDFASLNRGSTQPLITQSDLKSMKVIISSNSILENFEQLVNPFIKMISDNERQNYYLRQTRDSLLPRLMSGKIRVK